MNLSISAAKIIRKKEKGEKEKDFSRKLKAKGHRSKVKSERIRFGVK